MRKFIPLVVVVGCTLNIAPATGQTITLGETKVSTIFYVKEGTNSPYQGRLELTPEEHASIKPAELQARMMAQFNAWKAATAAAKSVPGPTADQKAEEVLALQSQADDLAARIATLKSDPAVVAKLPVKAKP